MNSLNFTGNIGRDAEIRYTAKQEPIVSFSVALSSGYGDRAITTWLNCTGFGTRYEKVAPYLVKGAQVAISGEFAARPYQTKDGVDKLSLDVRVNDLTLLGGKQSSNEMSLEERQRSKVDTSLPIEDIDSDLIPF